MLNAGPGHRFGLCYLDLDGFKTINDSLGHAAGDRLLVEVADRLQSCAMAPGEMVARLGGDEFVALTTGPDTRREVDELASRIMNALVAPISIDGRELTVRGSIGIVEGPAGERSAAEVLRSADITMYRAKSAGGNRFELADAEADARAITRHGLATALPTALDRGEFFIEYQPLVHLGDGSVRGAEALVRWLHPQHGVLGPDRFIPLAEHTGLIVPLGRWVLEQSVRQAKEWRERHARTATAPLRINVDLSPCQLTHPGLVQDTVDILETAGVDPDALCLEVTESALIGADDDLLKPLRRLAEMGVDIALDDFGTGCSNLADLRQACGERPQAGPLLHPEHAAVPGRPRRSQDRGRDRLPRPQPEPGGHGRGRGDRRPGRTTADTWLRHGAGLVLRPPGPTGTSPRAGDGGHVGLSG
ncbi:hypothetical protein SGLAM104S_03020 [Streptomyces glaucescens]